MRDATRQTVILDVLIGLIPSKVDSICTALLKAMTDPSVAWAFEQKHPGGPVKNHPQLVIIVNDKRFEDERYFDTVAEAEAFAEGLSFTSTRSAFKWPEDRENVHAELRAYCDENFGMSG